MVSGQPQSISSSCTAQDQHLLAWWVLPGAKLWIQDLWLLHILQTALKQVSLKECVPAIILVDLSATVVLENDGDKAGAPP